MNVHRSARVLTERTRAHLQLVTGAVADGRIDPGEASEIADSAEKLNDCAQWVNAGQRLGLVAQRATDPRTVQDAVVDYLAWGERVQAA